jgi:hypothetical protein
MEEWIRDGPCVGIKYYGGNPQGVTCIHPNNDPIIELAAKLQAIIYVHTWMIVGGDPRRPSRSYSTELSKVLDSDLSDTQRLQILGGNLRRIASPIFRRKGYSVDP